MFKTLWAEISEGFKAMVQNKYRYAFLAVFIGLLTVIGLAMFGSKAMFVYFALWAPILVAIAAFSCEYVDSALGMGYGTTLTPVLILCGYNPLDVVPAILCSELVTGLLSAAMHHRAGNVDLSHKSESGGKELKIGLILAACSIVGTLVAVFVALNVSKFVLKTYIGCLVLAMGLLILFFRDKIAKFAWSRIVGLGLLASFNKGMSGGGYGPVVVCGQMISGVKGKSAIAITSLAEGLTCAVGVACFLVLKGGMNWGLVLSLVIGATLSVPLAVYSVKLMSDKWLTRIVGVTTLILGCVSLWSAFK